jgi:hypothetical protein
MTACYYCANLADACRLQGNQWGWATTIDEERALASQTNELAGDVDAVCSS